MVELGARITAQKKTGCLAEGPLEVHVTDLGVLGLHALARRFVRALHQPCVGDEVADPGEAADVVYLIEDHQSKGLSYPWMLRSRCTATGSCSGTWAVICLSMVRICS